LSFSFGGRSCVRHIAGSGRALKLSPRLTVSTSPIVGRIGTL
jgi:hypothetical protein